MRQKTIALNMVALTALLQLLDVVSTRLFLNLGLKEGNPLWAYLLEALGQSDALAVLAVIKLALIVLTCLVIAVRKRDFWPLIARLFTTIAWLSAAVLSWNIILTDVSVNFLLGVLQQ